MSYSREQYLHAVESAELNYLKWEPGPMEVRMFNGVSLLRYHAQSEMGSTPGQSSAFLCWHTDSYELRDGLWLLVWSQATLLR